jgi:hypothetical protein
MPAQPITNRQDFKDYCLRRLGAPVININVDDTQVEDRVEDAIQYWQDYHFDGTQKFYWIKAITQTDVNNRYLDATQATDSSGNTVPIIGVSRIFPITDSQASINMFDLRYQLRLNELYDFTSASYINYTLTQQHLRSLELQFTGEVPIRWNRAMQRLYIDWDWGIFEAPVGQVVISECYGAIDPNVYTNMWNDRFLKLYATALIKRQWGENMKKFGGLTLPGGVTLNGKETFDEAEDEIKQLHQEMETNYGGPLEWFMN